MPSQRFHGVHRRCRISCRGSSRRQITSLSSVRLSSEITLTCSTRSSKEGICAIAAFQETQRPALEESGAKVTYSDGYPGWEADTENPLLKQAEKTFTRVLGKAPRIVAVRNAGLECGVIMKIIPDMRMILLRPRYPGCAYHTGTRPAQVRTTIL